MCETEPAKRIRACAKKLRQIEELKALSTPLTKEQRAKLDLEPSLRAELEVLQSRPPLPQKAAAAADAVRTSAAEPAAPVLEARGGGAAAGGSASMAEEPLSPVFPERFGPDVFRSFDRMRRRMKMVNHPAPPPPLPQPPPPLLVGASEPTEEPHYLNRTVLVSRTPSPSRWSSRLSRTPSSALAVPAAQDGDVGVGGVRLTLPDGQWGIRAGAVTRGGSGNSAQPSAPLNLNHASRKLFAAACNDGTSSMPTTRSNCGRLQRGTCKRAAAKHRPPLPDPTS